jgi:hypothetical protein
MQSRRLQDAKEFLNNLVVRCSVEQLHTIENRIVTLDAQLDNSGELLEALIRDLRSSANLLLERVDVVAQYVGLSCEVACGPLPGATPAHAPAPAITPTAAAEAEAVEMDAAMHRLRDVLAD